MELNKLRPAKGAIKARKRIGRGTGSGRGGTSTKGHKGAQSRSGFKNKRGFEGGQMPLQMRIPKRGFTNLNRVEYTAFNVSTLQEIADKYNLTEISISNLVELGMISKSEKVKVLGNGNITSKLKISFDKISEAAAAKIIAAGGTIVAA